MNLWHSFIHPVTGYFRKRRGQFLLELFPDISNAKICDIGGSRHFWEKLSLDIPNANIIIYNIDMGEVDSVNKQTEGEIEVRIYDGENIPHPDNYFDLCICNSVIEHVPVEQRANFAKELMRVSRNLFCQTPAREFPLEPHFIMPFIHWFPKNIGYLVAKISFWRILSRPSAETIKNYFYGTNLLNYRDLANLFPDCKIMREKIAFMTKSYYVVSK